MNSFIELLREGILVQGLVTTLTVATVCVQVLNNQTPSQELMWIITSIIAYYFGSKSSSMTQQAIKSLRSENDKQQSNSY